jgi:hypothetical protein
MLHGSGSARREGQARFLGGRRGGADLRQARLGGLGYRYDDLAADAGAGVRPLGRRREISRRAIAIWELSREAFIVATQIPDVAGIVIVGGVAIAPARQQDSGCRNGLKDLT